MPFCSANRRTTDSGKKNPSAFPALIAASRTFGATPTMPMPFAAAAIVPAVCVPCPLSSCAARPATGAPLTQLTLSATSRFAFRSGWLKSTPVSMSPTSTDRPPPVIACAAGALICRMSHCSGDSESLSIAGVLGSGAAGPASVAAEALPRSCTAKPAVEDAF